jgi:hypothetical protein
MADMSELRNLALHAAQRLEDEFPLRLTDWTYTVGQSDDTRTAYGRQLTGAIVAMAYAKGVLEMVAACMITDDSPGPSPVNPGGED